MGRSRQPTAAFPERLRAAREKRGLSQGELAARAGLQAILGRDPGGVPFPQARDAAGRRAVYETGGDLLVLELATGKWTKLGLPDAAETSARFSPDGARLAFVRDNDLWVSDVESGETTRLTSDGSDTIKNGTLSWVYWEEVFGREDLAYWWSPDSRSIAFSAALYARCLLPAAIGHSST